MLWKSSKEDIREVAQQQNNEFRAKTTKQMKAIKGDMDELMNHPNLDTNDKI